MESQIAKRYSKALFSLEKDSSNKNIQLLNNFATVINQDKKTSQFLKSPIVSKKEKFAVIENLMQKHQLEKKFLNFLKIIIEAGRIHLFVSIMVAYKKLVDESQGYISATITTAIEVTNLDRDKMIEKAKKTLGENIQVDFLIDHDILGGFVIKAGNKVLDLSLRDSITSIEKLVLA